MKRLTLLSVAALSGLLIALVSNLLLTVPASSQMLPAAGTGQIADVVEDSFESVLGSRPTLQELTRDLTQEDPRHITNALPAEPSPAKPLPAEADSAETFPLKETADDVTEASEPNSTLESDAITEGKAPAEPVAPAENSDATATEETAPEESADVEGSSDESTEGEAEEDSASDETVTEENADGESEEGESEDGDSENAEPPMTEAERIRRKLLIQADSEYQAGNYDAAEALYRKAKNETWLLPHQFAAPILEPFTDQAQLSPAAGVYWREAQAGLARDRTSQALVALALLTDNEPAFIPGQIAYANRLRAEGQAQEAAAILEQALTIYPDQVDLLLAQVDGFMAEEQWLEAAIASRQFVALNSDHPQADAQATLAAENLSRFQKETRSEIRTGAIANAFTGILGYAFTGSIFGPFTAANSAIMLLQGENAVGGQFANRIQQQLPMLQHPEANAYVRQLGKRLSTVTGRDDLDYEFFVILDPNLNAFALPGGKIFVNAGAILKTDSEAELAGLLAHELSHSVLSHGFQIATRGNLSSSIAQYLPYGGIINNVFLSGYSRNMERQADVVGTQILAAGGYAADGLHNVMITLNEDAEGPRPPEWISSHPNPENRVTYLKNLVERGGYNRYAYEGVATHEEIQILVARELAAYEAQQKAENGETAEEEEEAPETEEEQTDLYDAVERFDW
ncbi:MAG: M48 family metalloprotease [Cyanobacteria bacterium J06634_5]